MPKEIAKELVLPWPSRDLHPNGRVHWSKKAKAAKKAREEGRIIAIAANWDKAEWPEGRLFVWIDAYPFDKRRRDADGLLSSLKPWLDGIADAIGVDDSRFVPRPWIKDETRRPAEVRIRITDSPEGETK